MRIEQSMARGLWLIKRYSNIFFFSFRSNGRENRNSEMHWKPTVMVQLRKGGINIYIMIGLME